MKFNIFAVFSTLVTAAVAQGAKQTYIIGLQKGTVLSIAIEALLKLVSGVAAPGPAQQWSAGDMIGFTAILSPGQAKVLQDSPSVRYNSLRCSFLHHFRKQF